MSGPCHPERARPLCIRLYLIARNLQRVGPLGDSVIPVNRFRDGFLEIPRRLPAEKMTRLVGGEIEKAGFVESGGIVAIDPFSGHVL